MIRRMLAVALLLVCLVQNLEAQLPEWKWNNPPSLQHHSFRSKLVGQDVGYMIALPDDYHRSLERYPVIYYLHGANGDENSAWDITASKIGDAEPALLPVILVFVNGGKFTWYADSYDGKAPVESVIISELIPHIDRTYRTLDERKGRSIEGASMGGFGALSLAMRHPDLFCSVVAYAPALIQLQKTTIVKEGNEKEILALASEGRAIGDAQIRTFQTAFGGKPEYFESYNPIALVQQHGGELKDTLRVRIVVGSVDGLRDDCEAFHQLLNAKNYEHEFEVKPGVGHNGRKLFADGMYVAGLRFHQESRK